MASKSTKKDLVQHIAKALEVSPVEAERVMLVVMRYVRRQLLEDTSVILPGIGTLAVTETAGPSGAQSPHGAAGAHSPAQDDQAQGVQRPQGSDGAFRNRAHGGADFDAQ